ncbi:ATP-binding protein [Candidatus Dojkabacteria bacterium]|jgi:hypothetical protein|nr:ATP-binding protein [Candidatus Dojkabacteria bacterium]
MKKRINASPTSRLATHTLRNSGHTNYTAIEDLIDNPLDNKVKATEINVYCESEKGDSHSFNRIVVADNGAGMDIETLGQYFILGESKKNNTDLGIYGVGAKLAAWSIGKNLTVYSKQKNDKLLKASQSLDDMEKNNNFEVELTDDLTDLEIKKFKSYVKFFKNKISEMQGTVVVIENLDRLSNKSKQSFVSRLKEKLSLTYSNIIDNVTINVNDDQVKKIDYVGGKNVNPILLSEYMKEVEYMGSKFYYSAYYLPRTIGVDGKGLDVYDITPNQQTGGLWLFRNKRLVGSGIRFDNIAGNDGDGHTTRYRCLIYFDGNFDHIFGSTFNKIVQDKNDIDPEFSKLLREINREPLKEFRRLDKQAIRQSTDNKELSKKLTEAVKNSIKDAPIKTDVDKNTKHTPEEKKEDKETEPKHKLDPVKTRERLNAIEKENKSWLHEVEILSNGTNEKFYEITKVVGKYVLHLNSDHILYNEFFDKLEPSLQNMYVITLLGGVVGFNRSLYNEKHVRYVDDVLFEYEENRDKAIREFFKSAIKNRLK